MIDSLYRADARESIIIFARESRFRVDHAKAYRIIEKPVLSFDLSRWKERLGRFVRLVSLEMHFLKRTELQIVIAHSICSCLSRYLHDRLRLSRFLILRLVTHCTPYLNFVTTRYFESDLSSPDLSDESESYGIGGSICGRFMRVALTRPFKTPIKNISTSALTIRLNERWGGH